MPWCDPCSVFHAPTALKAGSCPDCGETVAHDHHDSPVILDDAERTVGQSAPWHFWIVVVALVGYIGWRIVDVFLQIF